MTNKGNSQDRDDRDRPAPLGHFDACGTPFDLLEPMRPHVYDVHHAVLVPVKPMPQEPAPAVEPAAPLATHTFEFRLSGSETQTQVKAIAGCPTASCIVAIQ